MTAANWFILACWLAFIVYWAVAAADVKRNVGARPWGREAWLRVAIVALGFPVFRVPVLRYAPRLV